MQKCLCFDSYFIVIYILALHLILDSRGPKFGILDMGEKGVPLITINYCHQGSYPLLCCQRYR